GYLRLLASQYPKHHPYCLLHSSSRNLQLPGTPFVMLLVDRHLAATSIEGFLCRFPMDSPDIQFSIGWGHRLQWNLGLEFPWISRERCIVDTFPWFTLIYG